jgi:8-oxo-dGTP diphosphatase
MCAALIQELSAIAPLDAAERLHCAETIGWIASGAELCRVRKPATPAKHLVSYFPVLDAAHILLVDHRNAGLWLPTGGHVEPGEHPRETVSRELLEELGIELATSSIGPPMLLTVTTTVGTTAGHTDVSLWYPVPWSRTAPINYDGGEFREARWFAFPDIPWNRTDPHLPRFLEKWRAATGA